ncbi:uncharacterized protein ACNLHF_015659 [Anomaloglossus baeobatrachus]|uniref:uncharacterized protein LOC142304368 n=1 Tax=Anomaloglossus baeobatrachus TaxID=238106 RepID=UPI003F50A924
MRRWLLVVLYFLSGAGSVEESSPLLDVHFTQRSSDSYLVICTPQIPAEEWVTQVHWKEEHANGTYSVIAVLNPHWGNHTKSHYQELVKLDKKESKAYEMEIKTQEMRVCCEVVTFPSGSIHTSCITTKEDSDMNKFRYAVLGTLLVGGFFALGSFVLVCHICWMKKSARRNFNLRSTRNQVLARSRSSQVPYRRTSPSINLAYEPPHDTDLHGDTPPLTRPHLQHPHPTILLPPEDLLQRNSTMNSHWPSEDLSRINPSFCNVSSLRNHGINEVLPNPNQIYSNIHHRNKQYPRVRHIKSLQIEPIINHHQPNVLSFEGTDPSSSIPHYHSKSCPWLFEGTSFFTEDTTLHPSRLNIPRTPESPFSTINPMYHSGVGLASQPNTAPPKYEPSMDF